MTDNTQELDEILNQAVNETHDRSLNINLSATASHNIRASIVDKAKQAITSLIEQEVAEAMIHENERVRDYNEKNGDDSGIYHLTNDRIKQIKDRQLINTSNII